jgi:hypothetical protein
MLRIDRVSTEMDLVPEGAPAGERPAIDLAALLADPVARQQIKELALDAFSERLRELERTGLV